MIQRILIATDGSEHGMRALDVASELAAGLGARLIVAHVLLHDRPSSEIERMAEVEHLLPEVAPEAGLDAANVPGNMTALLDAQDSDIKAARLVRAIGEKVLDRARKRAEAAGVETVTTRLCLGDFADELLDLAEADAADMMVLGRRGLGRLRAAILGSVSQKVLHYAQVPVLTVPAAD